MNITRNVVIIFNSNSGWELDSSAGNFGAGSFDSWAGMKEPGSSGSLELHNFDS